MNKKLKILVIFTFIILINTNISAKKIKNQDDNSIIYVDIKNTEGPWQGTQENPYKNIQDGINASTDKDTIYVLNGTYYERVTIDREILLIAKEKNKTIIDGGFIGDAVKIIHDNVKIINFTIRNSGGLIDEAGVKIESKNCLIKNCEVYKTKTGIYLNKSHNTRINNCTIHTNGEGILEEKSNKVVVEGCCFKHNSIGLNINKSKNETIRYSYFSSNGIACHFNGSQNIQINHCNISDNSVNLGGIFIVDCSDVEATNNQINHNGAGFHIFSSEKIHIDYCNLDFNTHFACALRTPSKNLIISNCQIRNNYRYGIYIEEGNSCTLKNNNIYNNKLYSIFSKFAKCNAKHNWWGTRIGPSYIDMGLNRRISLLLGKIKCFPWSLKSLDNIGSNWYENKEYMDKKINEPYAKNFDFPGQDTDNDGVPDWWEEKWGYNISKYEDHKNLDPDNDGLNNYEECFTDQYGSNPFHKDIFVEIDWMKSENPEINNSPPEDLIQELKNVYEEHNINLHVDTGQFGGGGEIYCCETVFSFAKLRNAYWNYFLNNQTNNPRKGIFHYGLICNYCPDLNFPFFGWDNLDSFAVSAQWLKEYIGKFSVGRLIVGATAHHLGHSLGLIADIHGGIDNTQTSIPFSFQWLKYHNYKSCMNYGYKYEIFSYSDGTNGFGDFDDWSNLDFSFFKNSDFKISNT